MSTQSPIPDVPSPALSPDLSPAVSPPPSAGPAAGPDAVDAADAMPTDEEIAANILATTGTEHIEAFEATRADRAALVPAALVPIFADIHVASSRVIGATLRSAEFEDEIAALPGYAGIREQCARYARAASQAQSSYLNTFTPPEGFVELIEELKLKRERYMHEAQGLVWREILVDQQLVGLNKNVGYRAVVYDVMRLCSMFREVMPKITGKSFLTPTEVTSVYALAGKAEKMLELREDLARARVAANDTRQRAFTLLSKAYDRLRRALTFIVWDDERLEHIAPSMQIGTRRSKPEEPAGPQPGEGGASPATPTTPPAGSGSPAVGGAPAAPVPQGLPGSNPFVSG